MSDSDEDRFADVVAARTTARRVRAGLGAATAVGLLVVGTSLLGGRDTGAPLTIGLGPVPSAPPAPVLSGSPTPLPARAALDPGTYAIRKPPGSVADYEQLVFTVPAGWSSSDGLVHKRRGQPGEVAFSAWTVERVYVDPCRWRTSEVTWLELQDEAIHEEFHTRPPGAMLLARPTGGLANQRGRGPAELVRSALGGEPALSMELSVPPDLDLRDCDQGQFRSWEGLGGSGQVANTHHAPAQVDTVYLVDLDRAPLVVDVSTMPGASPSDVAELDAIVASMVVDRGR